VTRPLVPHERNLYYSRVLAWTKKHPEKLAKVKVPDSFMAEMASYDFEPSLELDKDQIRRRASSQRTRVREGTSIPKSAVSIFEFESQ
jgi:hypothetical protein